ncbi:DUF308 domain-containing protein [Persicitalea sp.]|uniref:DUF308 domain-containing protein n=1 Tax=Persicitalea sp. TaxID=3100273 RepID=UPI0035933A4A
MKKISTVYLLSAVVLLGSCAREYPTFNQMPANVHVEHKDKVETTTKAPVEIAEAQVEVESPQPFTVAEISQDEKAMEMLAQNSPRQIDEQLETALASTQGQALMAKPLVAAQINKARKLIAQNEFNNSPLSGVQTSKASKMVNRTLKNHMEKSTLAPTSTKAAKELNRKIKIGLILIAVGILLSLIPGVWYLGGIVGTIGVVFIVLGLIENV